MQKCAGEHEAATEDVGSTSSQCLKQLVKARATTFPTAEVLYFSFRKGAKIGAVGGGVYADLLTACGADCC